MQTILKFCGLNAKQVAALDDVLTSDEVRFVPRFFPELPAKADAWDLEPFARKTKVVGDESHRYVYEIIVESELSTTDGCGGHWTAKCPRRIMELIYEAIGLFPTAGPYVTTKNIRKEL